MSSRKDVVGRYFDGFRRSDHEQILACLTDDVAWDLPGYAHLTGKDAFDQEIENDEFVGRPTLTVDRLVEEADTVVAVGDGEATRKGGAPHRFAFCDVFTFAGDEICRVESYLVPLTQGDADPGVTP
ncbi:MAG TPA: nuclear transport factor 2 family protein [Acidimicrobiales bacterium]